MRYSTLSQNTTHCVFEVQTAITNDRVDELRAEWEKNLGLFQKVDIDVSRVTRIDLMGLKLMIEIQRQAANKNRQVEFVGFNPAIEEALQVSRWFGELFASGGRNRRFFPSESKT
jgi:ABC-type transporter Mla MlaB component